MSLLGKFNDLPIMLQQRHGLHEGVGWILLNDMRTPNPSRIQVASA
jgi:hypothetical protein